MRISLSSRIMSVFLCLMTVGGLTLPMTVEAAAKVAAKPVAAKTKVVAKKVVAKKPVAKKVVKKATVAKTAKLDLYNPKKKYGDEKVDLANTASKCNTPVMRTQQGQVVERSIKDGATLSVTTSTPTLLGKAYRTYRDGLDILWDAMNEPYCGFGAFGVSAVKSSHMKNANKLRSNFLEKAKALKADGTADNASPVVIPPTVPPIAASSPNISF